MVEREDKVYSRIGIYGISNLINNKIYVGKTGMNFGDRWDSHRSLLRCGKHDNAHLQRAWDKYGENNFTFIIIEDCDVSELNDREIYWIKHYKDLNLSYNVLNGGDGGQLLGRHLSDETKRKIGEKNRINGLGRMASDETKGKMREAHLNKKYKPMSEDGKENLRRSQQQYFIDHPKKLTVEDVKKIRELRDKEHLTYTAIANLFNVTYQCINDIVNYKRWKSI